MFIFTNKISNLKLNQKIKFEVKIEGLKAIIKWNCMLIEAIAQNPEHLVDNSRLLLRTAA